MSDSQPVAVSVPDQLRSGLRPWFSGVSPVIALAHLLLESVFNFLPITYALLIPKLGLSYGQIGTMVFLMTLSGTITQPLFGILSDRGDPRKIVVLSIIWGGVLMGLVGFMPSYGWLAVLLVLAALGSAAFHPPAAVLAAQTEAGQRGRAMSLFSVGGNLGSAFSPVLVGVALTIAGLPAIGILIPLSIGIGLMLARRLRSVPLPVRPTQSPATEATIRRSGSVLAVVLIIIVVGSRSYFQEALMTYLPQWLSAGGQSLPMAGAALTILMVSVGIGGLIGGTLSDRFGRLRVIIISMLGMVSGQWLTLQLSGGWQMASVVLIGLMIGASFPVTIVLAQEALPRNVGFASAMVMGLGWLPAGIGALVVGQIADRSSLTAGLESLLFVPFVGLAAATLYFLFRRRLTHP